MPPDPHHCFICGRVLDRPPPEGSVRSFGAELVVPSLSWWPHFFDLTIVGHSAGPWEGAPFGKRGLRWTAHDDQGRTYEGTSVGAGSGIGLTNIDLTFIPTLASDTTSLTLDFPACFDGTCPRATFAISPEPR